MERLRRRRLYLGLRQHEVASLIGVGVYVYQRVEQGQQIPKIDMLVKIADVLKCQVEDLIDYDDYR